MINIHKLDEVLKHAGVKGMKWGVRRDRNRPGGADGKEESEKVKDGRNKIQKHLDSLKRERQWSKVLKEVDRMKTKDISKVAKRVSLENNLKRLSKTKMATKKDKEDYLRREFMSDQELSRKVARLQAKDSLHKTVRDASKEQRELGEKIVRVASSVGSKYVSTKMSGRRMNQDDIFDAVFPKDTKNETVSNIADKLLDRTKLSGDNRKRAKDILEKKYESRSKKS